MSSLFIYNTYIFLEIKPLLNGTLKLWHNFSVYIYCILWTGANTHTHTHAEEETMRALAAPRARALKSVTFVTIY